jgi:NADPH-dependent F420 reductase
MAIERIAVLGGTGPHGSGLAKRLVHAGYEVIVGSRDQARADAVASTVREATDNGTVTGAENLAAVGRANTVVLAIPADGLADFLDAARSALAGKLVVDVVVPLVMRDGLAEHAPPSGAASAGELVQRMLPQSRVVAAFQTIPAARLARLEEPLAGDVLVCGDDPAARAQVADLARRIPRLRAVDAGPMRNVRYVEGITALLVNLNRQHRAHTSITVLGLEPRSRRPPRSTDAVGETGKSR